MVFTGNNVTTTQGQLRASQGGLGFGGFTTGEVLSAFDHVYVKADGKIYKANAATIAKMMSIGMVLEAHGMGDTGVWVHAYGLVTNPLWVWTPKQILYVSVTVDGAMQITAPVATGNIAQVVAIAISSTTIIVCCAYPWVEVS